MGRICLATSAAGNHVYSWWNVGPTPTSTVSVSHLIAVAGFQTSVPSR